MLSKSILKMDELAFNHEILVPKYFICLNNDIELSPSNILKLISCSIYFQRSLS